MDAPYSIVKGFIRTKYGDCFQVFTIINNTYKQYIPPGTFLQLNLHRHS